MIIYSAFFGGFTAVQLHVLRRQSGISGLFLFLQKFISEIQSNVFLFTEDTKSTQPQEGDEEEGDGQHKERTPRYTKAQARQRFKKGKT